MKRWLAFVAREARVGWGCIALLTVGVFSRAQRRRVYTLETVLGLDRSRAKGNTVVAPTVPSVDARDLAPENIPVQLREPEAVAGNVGLFELLVLNRLVRKHAPQTILEIGTFDGRTTLNLAANAPAGARVVTLDLPNEKMYATRFPGDSLDGEYIEKQESGVRFRGKPEAAKITQVFGDSATFDFSPYRGAIDFVFVDGSHSYDNVRNDIEVALSLLRDGRGVILCHDYGAGWPGVTRAVEEARKRGAPLDQMRWVRGTTLVCLAIGEGK